MVHIPDTLRLQVQERAKGYCEYCFAHTDILVKMQVDYIRPVAARGSTTLDNLALACIFCNSYKGDRQHAIDSVTGDTVALFNPRTQNWHEHFQWAEGFTFIAGLTPVGRATAIQLRCNEPEFMAARQRWRKAGWQPPG